MTALAPTLQAFSPDRLAELHASGETVRAYRDTWRLMLGFPPRERASGHPRSTSTATWSRRSWTISNTTVTTARARLSAIHSLFRFAALRHPEHAATIGRVLAMPSIC